MNHKILLVDDEVNLLQSLRRNLRGQFNLVLAESGAAALQVLASEGPFAVVVSDMQMPEMDGLTLLKKIRDVSPDTVRVMLTGNVDQQTAVDAVNDGAIFRFLNKPCSIEKLTTTLNDAIRQHSLVTAEKELLSQTLIGSVTLMTELLALANHEAYGRSARLRGSARRLAGTLGWADAWQYEIAAMLSQVGCVEEMKNDQPNSDQRLKHQAELSARIVGRVPRLDQVAKMIELQFETTQLDSQAENIRHGAKMLRILIDFDLLNETYSLSTTLKHMEEHVGKRYDAEILEAFSELTLNGMEIRSVRVDELMPHMVIEQHIVNNRGDILISQGHELTESMIERLRSFRRNSAGIREPIEVRVQRSRLAEAII